MPYQLWSQDNFTKGELSPYMYGRAQVNQYFEGLKTAQNVLNYPTGAAGKRFGTLYQATLSGFTSFDQLYFQTFQYLNVCTFQMVFTPLNVAIYLEGILQANVVTAFDARTTYELSSTVLDGVFRVAGEGFRPLDLTVASAAGNIIVSTASNEFKLTNSVTPTIFPIQFIIGVGATIPTTTPQIKGIAATIFAASGNATGVYYFARRITATTIKVYTTAQDAKDNVNAYTLTNAGTGNITVAAFTAWSFVAIPVKNRPFYDFTGGYDAVTFTPNALTGAGKTLTAAGGTPFTAAHIGGAFLGNGGSARIVNVISSTVATIAIQNPFVSLEPIQGSLAILAEPAWSNERGWPRKCSSYQNRALFANSPSLQNGFWASVINDYTNFSDLTNDDDDAISWYPSSNDVNVIRFIVPYRSITVHTNSGIYSSPLAEINIMTPNTFTLQLQDSTPADVLLPQAIDNQIVVISGDDVHTMLWDGINNSYTSNIASIISEQLIRTPRDETSFADLSRAGSRYVFIINANGSMAIFQTLIAENVSGFTSAIMEQSYGDASFIQATSSFDGRCWFVVQRDQATAAAPIAITAFTSTTLTAVASNLSTTIPTAITFTTTGTLPAADPAIAILTYYWAIGLTADTFSVYLSQEDAENGDNAIEFSSAGVNSNLVKWPLATVFTLEELSQDVHLDCAVAYDSTPTSTITTGALFNAQDVKMVGDGFGFEAVGVNNTVSFEAHGEAVLVSEAFIGFPINTIMEPMPIALPKGENTSLTKPTHIRSVRFMFNNTIGGTVNGIPIALNRFDQTNIGDPPVPANGIFELNIMKGWDDFNNPSFTIEHNEPFNIELIGVFYSVEV